MSSDWNEEILDDAAIIHRYTNECIRETDGDQFPDADYDDPRYQGFLMAQIAASLQAIVLELAALRYTVGIGR